MPTPMPSPFGTNHERLYLPTSWPNPEMALDAAPRRARDQEDDTPTAQEVADALRSVLEQMEPDEADQLRLLLGEIVSEESAAQSYGSGNSTYDSARRALAADEALARKQRLRKQFPHGRPGNTSGFRKRFPGAGRIGHV